MKGRATPERLAERQLVRSSYEMLELYEPGRGPVALDLSDNTNLAGLPPTTAAILASAGDPARSSAITRYPSLWASDLKRAVASYLGVPAECVTTGAGSDDVLDSIVRACSEPGERLAFPDPTFAMLPHLARTNALEPVAVALRGSDAGHDVDAAGLLAAEARITYVCSPNNPTGTLASAAALEALLAGARGLVVVDQAYAEYQDPSGAPELARRATTDGRLVVVRTLSKAFGLAGMRVGYAVTTPALAQAIDKSRGPYKVGRLAEDMAVAALTGDLAWVRERAVEVVHARDRFVAFLRAIGRDSVASCANFTFVPVEDARASAAALRERGVGVRAFAGAATVGDGLRISMAPWSVLEPVMPVFEEVLHCAS
jgi:histidinol-phosphate aminotransferase